MKASFFLLCIVIFGGLNSQSQIYYTDIPDTAITFPVIPFCGNLTNTFGIDLNNDTQNDFNFVMHHWQTWETPSAQPLHYESYITSANGLNKIARNDENCAIPMEADDTINENLFYWDPSAIFIQAMGYYNPCYCSFENKYFGLQFNINSISHYGWVRVTGTSYCSVIFDFAYNMIPETPILAGQTSITNISDHNSNIQSEIKIIKEQAELKIKSYLYELYNVIIVNQSGIVVQENTAIKNQINIPVSNLHKGFYILLISHKNGVLRKKIVL